MNRIAAVIVTYNRLDQLKTTLSQSIEEPFCDIVVVDNASDDGTLQYLRSIKDPRVHHIRLEKNIGGAGGFFRGFQYVIDKLDTEWLVCYDDDAYPKRGALKAFSALNPALDVASIAAAVYLPDGDIARMNIPRYNPFTRVKELIRKGREAIYIDTKCFQENETFTIDMSSFVGYFIRTDLIKKYRRYPDPKLFIYADDLIYSYGWRKLGYKHIFAPAVMFIHDSQTLGKQQRVYQPLWKVYYTYRNSVELYRELLRPAAIVFALAKYIDLLMLKGLYAQEKRSVYLRYIHIALRDALMRNFDRDHREILSIEKD
jgi:GT2 family glycosyltransferase